MSENATKSRNRLAEVILDETTIPRGAADLDHEREVAIFDLIEENSFAVPGRDDGPYTLAISQEELKLTFDVRAASGDEAASIVVSMTPFRPLLKDYFLACETYYSAIRTASARQIEAIDRQRTTLHNEGAELMAQRLAGKVEIDQATARRLFTLVSGCAGRLTRSARPLPRPPKTCKAGRESPSATSSSPTRACLAPPLTPEIKLWLADEAVPIWKKTEEELGALGLPPPFWAFAWAGGQALARYVLDNPALVQGKRALDFASGSGLVAIAAAKAGAAEVEASDIDAFAIAAIAANAAENGVSVKPRLESLIGADEGWDVVLAGDVAYEKDLAEAATDWLIGLARRGATVLIGDPRRTYLPLDRLECVIEYSVPVTRELEDSEIKRTGVFRFR